MAPQVAIQQGPYNLGQAIFTGSYKVKKPASTHVAEKDHRLSLIIGGLPAADRQKINPKTLANELTESMSPSHLPGRRKNRRSKLITLSNSAASDSSWLS
jgi:hypothetical protein